MRYIRWKTYGNHFRRNLSGEYKTSMEFSVKVKIPFGVFRIWLVRYTMHPREQNIRTHATGVGVSTGFRNLRLEGWDLQQQYTDRTL